jgi:hypothetical protein
VPGDCPFLYESRKEPARYVALSHCWGIPGNWRTMQANYSLLQSEIPFPGLPQTFRDAVHVTRGLGIRYLWIDSFCIIQDNKEDWEVESSNMAAIYANAYLVIGADKSEDSKKGFLGGYPGARSECIATVENSDGSSSKLYARIHDIHGEVCSPFSQWQPSPLRTRGWALQEQVLATRMVHFTEKELHWECRTANLCECMELDTRASSHARGDYRTSLEQDNKRLRLSTWHGIVERYFHRSLTKLSDFLPALSGIVCRMQKFGAGEYLAGLWKESLLEDLLWSGSSPLTSRAQPYRAPTWSWASLKVPDGKFNCLHFWCTSYDLVTVYTQVLDARCIPSGRDPTGGVASGYITLAGQMLPAVWKSKPRWDGNLVDELEIHGADLWSVSLDVELDPKQNECFYALLIASYGTRAGVKPDLIGLLLRKLNHNGHMYEKVGLFQFFSCWRLDLALVLSIFEGTDTVVTIL